MSKKKRGAQKPIPKTLRTPMTFDWDFLVTTACAQHVGERTGVRAVERNLAEIHERLLAVYEYFDILPDAPEAQFELLLRLCADRFPKGFRVIPQGQNVMGPYYWTMHRRIELVEFIDRHRERGLTVMAAAERYLLEREKNMWTADHVLRRYYESRRKLSSKALSTHEKLELSDVYSDQHTFGGAK